MQHWRGLWQRQRCFEMCQLQFSWPQALKPTNLTSLWLSRKYCSWTNDTLVIPTEHEQICDVFAMIWKEFGFLKNMSIYNKHVDLPTKRHQLTITHIVFKVRCHYPLCSANYSWLVKVFVMETWIFDSAKVLVGSWLFLHTTFSMFGKFLVHAWSRWGGLNKEHLKLVHWGQNSIWHAKRC